jgi:DNA-binding transcriptional ArsR family regulator
MTGSGRSKDTAAEKQWTFLTNHALVLLFLARHPRITARELALDVGITERAVRTIIADLEVAGYIGKTREGRQVQYDVNHEMPLRHRTQQDTAVGDLLQTLGLPSPLAG